MKPSTDALLECCGLACGYPGRLVLQNVDLSLRSGSVVALLGANGSGKSTLLKTLCKTLPAIRGSIRVQGDDLDSLNFESLARWVAYVPQEELSPFRFTVLQTVVMGRLPHSHGLFDTREDLAVAEEAMRGADCWDLRDRAVTEISGGERQRALIARALAQQAPVLLLDEPTSHLDVAHQIAIVGLLRKLATEGRAILAAVHDLNLALSFADQAILLHDGEIAFWGACEELIASPALNRAFGVRFKSFQDPDGETRVFPQQ